MQFDADLSHRGAQAWTGTTLTLEICLLCLFSWSDRRLGIKTCCTLVSATASPYIFFFKNFVTGMTK